MQGVQRAYYCAPWTPGQLHGAMNFAVTAADAGLEVVVALTQWLAQPQHPSVATRQSYMTDRVFDWMPGVDSVTINTGWFADNYMTVLGPIDRNRSHSDGDIVLDSFFHRLSFLRHLLHVARYRQAFGDCGYIGTASA